MPTVSRPPPSACSSAHSDPFGPSSQQYFAELDSKTFLSRSEIPSGRTTPSMPAPRAVAVESCSAAAWSVQTHWTAPTYLPPSPPCHSSNMALSASPPSIDVEMMDAYATPPTSRILPTKVNIAPSLASKSSHVPPPIKTSPHLLGPQAPLTPPLTPPMSNISHSLAGGAPPPPPPHFPTQSARALHNYHLHPIFASEYWLEHELGSGGFGFVIKASRESDGFPVAVKFIERAKIPQHGWANTSTQVWGRPTLGRVNVSQEGKMRIPMEAYVLGAINLEGVVEFIDLFEDSKYFYLVMELHGSPWQKPPPAPAAPLRPALGASFSFTAIPTRASETPASSPILPSASLPSPSLSPPRPAPMMRRSSCDLFECIEQNSRFDEDTARYVFAQIVDVVYCLNKMGVCHRDIKDENIVISNDLKVKLIDFGSAVIFDPNGPAPVYDRFYGTTAFASAEILRGQRYEAPPAEVWSLGVLLSILLTGECPFADPRAAADGRVSARRVRIGFEVENLMKRCLDVDPRRRITIGEIRHHRWLRSAFSSGRRTAS